MIKSMTGYGLASADLENAKFTVEIKSLNSKFLELSLKLPKLFADKEFFLRTECSKQLERGKVNVSFTIESNNPVSSGASINTALLKHYFEQVQQTATELGVQDDKLFSSVLSLPDVIQYTEEGSSEDEWKAAFQTFNQAVEQFQKFRQDEGNILEKDLQLRISNILNGLKEVEKLEPNRLPVVRERISQYLDEAVGRDNIDQNRLEQELVYYIEKFDIQEEKIRLKAHCDYFIQTLKEKDANGKKLGFISQEIGREINTMGSKANDAQIQQAVVLMKEELEKIKEQLLNVL